MKAKQIAQGAIVLAMYAQSAVSCSGSGLRDDGGVSNGGDGGLLLAEVTDATAVDNRLKCGPAPHVIATIRVTSSSGAPLEGITFSSPMCPGVTQTSDANGDIQGYVTKDTPFYARFDADAYASVLSSEQRYKADSEVTVPMLPSFVTGILPNYDPTRGAVLISLTKIKDALKPCDDTSAVKLSVKDLPNAKIIYFAEGLIPTPIDKATETSKAGFAAIVDLDVETPITVTGKKKNCLVSFTRNGATGRAPLEKNRLTLMSGLVYTPPPPDAGVEEPPATRFDASIGFPAAVKNVDGSVGADASSD